MKTIYIGLDEDVVVEAVEEARYLLRIAREQELRLEEVSSIFNCVSDGVVAVDRQGQITSINTLAKGMLGLSGESWRERRLPDLVQLPGFSRTPGEGVDFANQLVRFGEAQLVASARSFRVGGQVAGTVVTLQRVDSIQRIESKIRISSIEKGLYAKKTFQDVVGGARRSASSRRRRRASPRPAPPSPASPAPARRCSPRASITPAAARAAPLWRSTVPPYPRTSWRASCSAM